MNPYDAFAKCSKCGGAEVASIYCKATSQADYEPIFAHKGINNPREHIDRICTRCHFEWVEAVLPKEKPNEP